MKQNKIFILIGLVIVVGILMTSFFVWKKQKIESIDSFQKCADAGYPILESFPEQCKRPDGKTFVKPVSNQDITVSGDFVCLPHKIKDGPQTLECAFGIKDGNNNHYALADPDFKYTMNLGTGSKIKVVGKLQSTDESKYDILGTITITNLEKL